MTTFRFVAPVVLIAALAVPAMAAAPAPTPVVTLSGHVAFAGGRLRPGTPVTFTLDTRFGSVPPGADFVLQRAVYLFPRGTVVNGRLFPSCSVARLVRARGRLSACPKGSQIGSGFAVGTAPALGLTSRARVTLFNGPSGRSITTNVSITAPALIDATFPASFAPVASGPYAQRLTIAVPDTLTSVLDVDVVVTRIHVTTGAARTIRGVRRGYVEALRCPRSGKARIHGDFFFSQGAATSAETTVPC